ncbi:hypothetical protein M404DRAFT_396349 [Pisolithus tinctorius Marx 270]|uniref:Uncharacterized protein n=1 Tax=Pisolithus tinctorius Marx 270 TaxID=870435 RepID=A0A0C3P425_PISTI|nr:hypothetical protein M404DRAFT_396349 [Pisolithus tinctorius Marx 270]
MICRIHLSVRRDSVRNTCIPAHPLLPPTVSSSLSTGQATTSQQYWLTRISPAISLNVGRNSITLSDSFATRCNCSI